MDKLRSFLCFGLLIVLLNMQPPAFDSDHEMPISIDINYQAETIPAVQKNLPRDLPWPPFKGDSPYRRVIVELESEPTSLKRVSLQHSGFGERELGSRITDHYLELFTEHELFKSRLRLLTAEHEVLWDYYNAYNGLGLIIHEKYVSRLEVLPGVRSVSHDMKGQGALSDSVKLINADDAWQTKNATGSSLNGEGVVVAVLDTGIDYNHKDLGGDIGPNYKVIGGYDFVNDDADPMDDNYHGTMVSGIIAASGTVTGVAPNASLLAYKVSDETDNAMMTDTIAGLDRALDPDSVPATDDAADIICISLSWFGTPYNAISKAVDNAFAAGSLPVVAAGNNGPDLMTLRSPGAAYGALTLGATTKADEIATLSSRGPVGLAHVKPDMVAPGIDIFTTYLGNSYGTLTGTSASAPHAVGAAALLKQQHPNWTASELKDALTNNAFDLGGDAVTQGAGRLDVLAAVDAKLRASPGVLSFEEQNNGVWDETISEILTFNNSHNFQADCAIEIKCYYSADKELWEVDSPVQVFNYIQPSSPAFSVPALGTKDITFTLNIPGAAEQGYYWGRVEIKSANDNLTVPFGFRNIDITTDKGEWIISTDTNLDNQQFRAKNLTVTNNAKVTLDNVTIFIDSIKDGLSLINVTEGSSIAMNYCTIASYNPSIYYNFTLYGRGTIRNSHLSGMWGVYRSPYPGGINIYSDNSEVSNSTVFRCYTNGVFSAETDGVLVADNYIHHNGGEGVLVWQVTGIKILRNNCSRNWWDGVGITGGNGIIADNSFHFNSYDGIWVNNSSPYIANNVVTQSGYWMKHQDAAGIKFQRGSAPIMENNIFSGNKYYGFYINASSPVVKNTSINDSQLKDVFIVPHKGVHCEPTFINSTYNSVTIPLSDPDSKITRQWFMQISVSDDTGKAVPGATVKLFDRNNALVKQTATDALGITERFIATQYIRTLSKTDYLTPYRLEINMSSIKTTVADIFLPESKTIEALLSVPDLEVTKIIQTPDPGFANESVTFSVIIFNNASTALTNITLICKLNDIETPLAEFKFAKITPGEEKNVSFSRVILDSGDHELTAELSSEDNIIERTLDNNILNYPFTLYKRPAAGVISIGQSHTYVHEPIIFTAAAAPGDFNITGYQFSFSDGTTTPWQADNITTHVFSNLSFEHVSFRLKTDSGFVCNWSEPLWLQIIERLPFAGFDFTPSSGDIFTSFDFSLLDEIKSIEGIINVYRWEFGDGAYSTDTSPDHTYIDDGIYNVSLALTYSTDGGTAMFWKSLQVSNLGPVAGFFASGKTINLGDSVTFNASTTTDQDDLLAELTFSWQFGDESTGSGVVVAHKYTEANTYLVILTVTDDDNETSRFTLEITVRDTAQDGNGSTSSGDGPDLTLALVIISILVAILVAALAYMLMVAKRKKVEMGQEGVEELEE